MCLLVINEFRTQMNAFFGHKTKEESSQQRRLGNLIKLVSQMQKENPNHVASLQAHFESLNLLIVFIDNFLMLGKSNEQHGHALNSLITKLNYVFDENTDFRRVETVQSLNSFLIECSSKL